MVVFSFPFINQHCDVVTFPVIHGMESEYGMSPFCILYEFEFVKQY